MSVLWEHMTPDERRKKVELADMKYAYLLSGGTVELADELKGEVVDENEGLLSSRDLLAVFGIANIRTVAKMRLEQGLPSIKTRGKHMFSPDEVLAWAKKARRHVNLRALWAGTGA